MPRRPRNRRPDLNGLLVIDKPSGMTSMDVCRVVRGRTGGAKVGHAGTLDPLATGVLVVCLGRATKSIDGLMATEKRYLAEVDLSAFSMTDDMESEAEPVDVDSPPDRAAIDRACAQFTGEIMQAPPVYSAVHVEGERAYKLARRGEAAERPPARPVVIHSIDVVEYTWPSLTADIRCGKGTYIRSLARDLGESLGTGGRLRSLRRTAVGPYTIEDASRLDDLPTPLASDDLLPAPPPEGASSARSARRAGEAIGDGIGDGKA